QSQKDEAARRLLQMTGDTVAQLVRNFLIDPGNRSAQLAVARAIASESATDLTFVDPLFALMGHDRTLTEAAADALAAFNQNLDVLARLSSRFAAAREQKDFA